MSGHQRLTATVATVFAATTLGAAVAAAQTFGMLGLAVTMALGIAAQNVVLLILARRRLGVWTQIYVQPRAVANAVASVARVSPATPMTRVSPPTNCEPMSVKTQLAEI